MIKFSKSQGGTIKRYEHGQLVEEIIIDPGYELTAQIPPLVSWFWPVS